jgi:hypothetical protein
MSTAFRKLGLGGGGMKGVLHIGALQELSKYQKLYFPDGVYGCSIGAVIATFVAFEIPLKQEIVSEYMRFDKVMGKPTFQQVAKTFSSKGMFSMHLFEKTMIEMFDKEGVNMREMTLGDAKMPLYIVASNITKGVPTVFSKQVRVLDALKCSCSIPGVFKPQELYGSLYVDGGLFVPCLSQLIPDALVIFLAKKQTRVIDAKSIETMNPFDYMRCLYSMSTTHIHKFHKSPTTLELEYPGLNTDSNLEDFELDKVMEKAAERLNNFLSTQRLLQKVPESVGVGSPLHLK